MCNVEDYEEESVEERLMNEYAKRKERKSIQLASPFNSDGTLRFAYDATLISLQDIEPTSKEEPEVILEPIMSREKLILNGTRSKKVIKIVLPARISEKFKSVDICVNIIRKTIIIVEKGIHSYDIDFVHSSTKIEKSKLQIPLEIFEELGVNYEEMDAEFTISYEHPRLTIKKKEVYIPEVVGINS
jgi:3-deoxy-D-arabino-heptulosonate 7-phosphate (DAHP) synthase class II